MPLYAPQHLSNREGNAQRAQARRMDEMRVVRDRLLDVQARINARIERWRSTMGSTPQMLVSSVDIQRLQEALADMVDTLEKQAQEEQRLSNMNKMERNTHYANRGWHQ